MKSFLYVLLDGPHSSALRSKPFGGFYLQGTGMQITISI